ncbi:MAG TPA: hypothetical protein VNP73_00795 [Actinomycetota bacterium]|nr:hypothetical protein [Actinomycetota bacterium]
MLTATDPQDGVWKIKRHWISRKPRLRWRKGSEEGLEALEFVGGIFDDNPFGIIVGLIAVVLLLLLILPVFAFLIELLIVGVLLAVTLAAKILFRRPWIIEAWQEGARDQHLRWAVVGWNRSGEVMDEVARTIASGGTFLSPHATPINPGPSTQTERAAPEGGSR